MKNNIKILLASASPRRLELLQSLGFEVEAIAANVDETQLLNESPEDMVLRLSLLKAKTLAQKFPDRLIVAADTTVVFDNKSIGKPESKEDAFKILKELQGNFHTVFTGCTILQSSKNFKKTFLSETKVEFFPISDEEIKAYIETGEPMDKAGAYGAQGLGAQFIKGIIGSYFNVVGLDLGAFMQNFKQIVR